MIGAAARRWPTAASLVRHKHRQLGSSFGATSVSQDTNRHVAYDNAKREVTRRLKMFGKEGQIKKAVNEVAEAARIGIPLDTQVIFEPPKK